MFWLTESRQRFLGGGDVRGGIGQQVHAPVDFLVENIRAKLRVDNLPRAAGQDDEEKIWAQRR